MKLVVTVDGVGEGGAVTVETETLIVSTEVEVESEDGVRLF